MIARRLIGVNNPIAMWHTCLTDQDRGGFRLDSGRAARHPYSGTGFNAFLFGIAGSARSGGFTLLMDRGSGASAPVLAGPDALSRFRSHKRRLWRT
jgi:hypothetical protein